MSQEGNARPVHSQGLLLIAVVAGVLMMAVYLTSNIVDNQNGAISAAVRTIGVGLAIWSLVKPKAGLYIVSIEAFSLDFVKKIAVYYGTVSMGTIIEVLVVGMLAVLATTFGILLQSVAFRRFKMTRLQWGVVIVTIIATLASLYTGYKRAGFEKGAENAFNGCFYIMLALPMSVVLTERDQVRKLLSLQFFLATLWAAWGIKQYYAGFTSLEWYYAETGLSGVASAHMVTLGDTRPFGFGTGVANYSVLSGYLCYGAWHFWNHRRQRLLFLICTLIVFWGVVTSLQRTVLVMPIFAVFFYYCLQSKRRSVIAYFISVAVFVSGVISSEYLYAHILDVDDLIRLKGNWTEAVLTFTTYSARLESWTMLKHASTYSLIGLTDPPETHDGFTSLVVNYGVVGLAAVVLVGTGGAWFVQRTILRVEDPQDRQFAIFCLTITVTTLALGFVGGDNFTANPVNLQLWCFFGAAISMAVNSRLAEAAPRHPSRILEEFLKANGPRVPMAARAALARAEA